MKIVQVIPYFFPSMSFGGPAKVVYQFSRELAKRHTVTVLTSAAYNKRRRIASTEKIKKPNISKYCILKISSTHWFLQDVFLHIFHYSFTRF